MPDLQLPAVTGFALGSAGGEAPEWFTAALARQPHCGSVEVDGCSIAFRAWGQPSASAVLLVHGGTAHARWWDHVAPQLAHGRQVIALDLSGHGSSGRRAEYSIDQWASEVVGLAKVLQLRRLILVGHSLGGYVALRASTVAGPQVDGVMAVDTKFVSSGDQRPSAPPASRSVRPLRTYRTRQAALARFHPVPDVDVSLHYVVAHVAETSVCAANGGWQWKFDPRVLLRDVGGPVVGPALVARVALLRAERGLLSPAMASAVERELGRSVPLLEIPNASHHAMLDEPLALVAALRSVIGLWECGSYATVRPHPVRCDRGGV